MLAGCALVFLVAELRQPLRKRKQAKAERLAINAGVATLAVGALRWVLLPGIVAAALQARRQHNGLRQRLALTGMASHVFSLLLLDYGNYLWHVLLHRWPFLWRFHQVHHSDLDLDLSTAWRFHVGEVLLSTFFRGAVARLLGPDPKLVVFYEIAYEGATAFHHSNWRLPFGLEKQLNKLIVTPRMHGIHHSVVQRETDSNFSIVLSVWDRLHRSRQLGVRQADITIGIPSIRTPEEVTLGKLLAMPLRPVKPWQLPDGTVPERVDYQYKNELLP